MGNIQSRFGARRSRDGSKTKTEIILVSSAVLGTPIGVNGESIVYMGGSPFPAAGARKNTDGVYKDKA